MPEIIEFPGKSKVLKAAAPDCAGEPVKLGSCQAYSDIIRRGQAVLARLECNLTWEAEWRDLILALGEGRDIALRVAGADRPQGAEYRKAIGPWLRCYGFDRINEGDRSRLLRCFDNLTAINAWRLALPVEQQAKLNNPRIVLAHWLRSLPPASPVACRREGRSGAENSAANITIADVLAWLPQATAEEKRRVAVALAQDTALMKKILPSKALPPKATPKQIFSRAMGLLAAGDVPPVH